MEKLHVNNRIYQASVVIIIILILLGLIRLETISGQAVPIRQEGDNLQFETAAGIYVHYFVPGKDFIPAYETILADSELPLFDVYPNTDYVRGENWLPDTELSFTINSETFTFESDPMGGFDFYDFPVNLVAGDTLELSDGESTKSHTILTLTLESVDQGTDTVTGTAEPGTEVWSGVCDPEDCYGIWVTAEPNGDFIANMSSIGIDIQQGTSGIIGQADDDGDGTCVGWRIPDPHFEVNIDVDEIRGYDWIPNTTVTMTIGEQEWTTESDDQGFVFFDTGEFDIVPGYIIELDDGTFDKSHTVRNLSVTLFDKGDDMVWGTAYPGEVIINGDDGTNQELLDPITVDGFGNWEATFNSVDVAPGTTVWVDQYDDDGDWSEISWVIYAELLLMLDPEQQLVYLGQTFDVDILVEAPYQLVDGVSAYLNFDPTKLQVVNITPGTGLPTQIQNQYDNQTGQIDFAYGTFSDFPSGTFVLATITFEAVATTSVDTPLSFNAELPRKSDVTYAGYSIIDGTLDGSVTISDNAGLRGSVDLQGRPTIPHSTWSVPLQISMTPIGETTALFSFNPTTDDTGAFSFEDILPGTYTVSIKNSHTLQNCQVVALLTGINTVDFGVLREGDANDDNCVSMVDFSILVGTFGVCGGEGAFDPRADFNEDNCVNIVDFSLLRPNFGSCGDCEGDGEPLSLQANQAREAVSISIESAENSVNKGGLFKVSVQVDSGSQPVDGAAAYINFDPTKLKVISITPGTTLPTQIQNQYDNLVGHIDYAYGIFSNFPSGTFELMEITFQALDAVDQTELAFNLTLPRLTDVTYGGGTVLTGSTGEDVTILEGTQVFLPLIVGISSE